jgi:hypothetical protein
VREATDRPDPMVVSTMTVSSFAQLVFEWTVNGIAVGRGTAL